MAICCAISSLPPLRRYSVIPVARKEWHPGAGDRVNLSERYDYPEQPGFDPRTFVRTQGRADRQAEPLSPAKDIKTQAAEGVAAFRARREKERQRSPEKSLGEQMAERLKAQIEAEQRAAEQKRQAEQERSRDRDRDRGRDGPSWG